VSADNDVITYGVVGNDGQMIRIETGDWRSPIGPPGVDRVALHPVTRASGWVNESGHHQPETHPRNLVGSILLYLLGAPCLPYAGPVVITGWDPPPGCEVIPLVDSASTGVTASYLTEIVTSIPRVLGLEPGPVGRTPSFANDVLYAAEIVTTAPTPRLVVLPTIVADPPQSNASEVTT
jgi:hypothetical protein